jgi:hypothetical protein
VANPRLLLLLSAFLLSSLVAPCLADDVATLPSMPSLPSGDNKSAGGVALPNSPEWESNRAAVSEGYKGTSDASRGAEGVKANKNKIVYNRLGGRIDTRIEGAKPTGKPIQNLGEARPGPKAEPQKDVAVPSNHTIKWPTEKPTLRTQ